MTDQAKRPLVADLTEAIMADAERLAKERELLEEVRKRQQARADKEKPCP